MREHRRPSLIQAIVPLMLLAAAIGGAIALFGLSALSGPIPAAMLVCAMLVSLIAMRNGHTWAEVEDAAKSAVGSVTGALLILFGVGALIGVWNLSGTIPTLVYYGMQVLAPEWHYIGTLVVCAVVALSIGSSWTTAGTVGVGLVGIAMMLGISPAITAGAVISGAYLGDKLSPLSETTVLTSQINHVDLHRHIAHQAKTSLPAFGIAAVGMLLLGLFGPTVDASVDVGGELEALADLYWITPWNLLPLLLLLVLSVLRVPAVLALLGSSLFAGIVGGFTQVATVARFDGSDNPFVAALRGTWRAMATGFTSDTGLAEVDQLLSRGGMSSMLTTVWLIVGAVIFGGVLERFGLLSRLIDPLVARATTTGRLFLTVFGCGIGLNVVAGDQYVALILPSKIFKATFAERGLGPRNLSRLAADSGTVTSPLVPWNSCGAFMSATLGVATIAYLPFALFNLASPLLSVVYGFTGFTVERVDDDADDPAPARALPPEPIH